LREFIVTYPWEKKSGERGWKKFNNKKKGALSRWLAEEKNGPEGRMGK